MERETGHLPFDPKDKVKSLIWIKIVGIGDTGTGKTCLIKHFCESKFTTAYQPTVGVDYGFKIQNVQKEQVRVHLWDLSGNPEYHDIRNELYSDSNVVFLVYDIANEESFNNLDTWLQEVKKFCRGEPIMALVANKSDLKPKRLVSMADGKRWARERNIRYYETSPATGEGVAELFTDVLSCVKEKIVIAAGSSHNPNLLG